MPARDELEDRAHFTRRANEERDKAATCEDNTVAIVHLKLADEYSKRAADLTAKPRLVSS